MALSGSTSDARIGTAVFVAAFLVFWLSPVRQIADSNGSMLLSQSLVQQRSFELDRYFPGGAVPSQFESVHGHLYYWFPPGTSILSAPLVAGLNALGLSATQADGSYDPKGEERIEGVVASVLMAALAVVLYGTARLLLSPGWSLLVAGAASLGTQVWSTASRATWSHTWEILLLALAVRVLLAYEAGRGPQRPAALGGLAALLYVVRPTGILPLCLMGLYLAVFRRPAVVRYAAAAALGLGLFVLGSFTVYGSPLPRYFRVAPLLEGTALVGLAGNLFSPSRGLFVYVPVLAFVLYLLWRYRGKLSFRPLAALAALNISAHLVLVSIWPVWWGGHSYGPRLTTCVLPWFVLLGILALRARLDAPRIGRLELTLGGLLLAASIVLNGAGALSWASWLWNTKLSIYGRARLWDWRRAQFLAAFVWPLPGDGSNLGPGTKVAIGTVHAEPYLGQGWSVPQAGVRWTSGPRAEFVFNLDEPNVRALRMRIQPFVVPGRLERQRVIFVLNGTPFRRMVLHKATSVLATVEVPRELLREHNVLELQLPDATAPAQLGLGVETAALGLAVWWLELQ
jgi:hypothetical protein